MLVIDGLASLEAILLSHCHSVRYNDKKRLITSSAMVLSRPMSVSMLYALSVLHSYLVSVIFLQARVRWKKAVQVMMHHVMQAALFIDERLLGTNQLIVPQQPLYCQPSTPGITKPSTDRYPIQSPTWQDVKLRVFRMLEEGIRSEGE